MTETHKLRVFLCHASQDKPIVRELYRRLDAEGWIDPWLDKEKLLPGQEWELEIEKSVETADVVIICLSKSSTEKEGYYQKEIKKILDVAEEKSEGTIFIIPLRLDDCQISHRLSKWQHEDYFPVGQREQAYRRLLQSLNIRLDQLNSRNNIFRAVKPDINSFINSLEGWDEKWLEKHRSNAQKGMKRNGFAGFVEIKFTLSNKSLNVSQKELLSAAQQAQVPTFGWPIGIVIDAPEGAPKPLTNGIMAEVELKNMQWQGGLMSCYDYWVLKNNGDFYLLKSLFEDSGFMRWVRGTLILYDTRIQRTTEILLYCEKLYSSLGVDSTAIVNVSIKYGELKDRQLSATKNFMPRRRLVCTEPEMERTIQMALSNIKANLVNLVKEFTQPLFLLFDFQEFDDNIYENIVDNFARGKLV